MSSILMVDQITDSAGTGSPTFPNGFTTIYASANNSSSQSIVNGSAQTVTNWTTELDPGSIFNPTTGVITIPKTGIYQISYYGTFQAAASLDGLRSIILISPSIVLAQAFYGQPGVQPGSTFVTGIFNLNSGSLISFSIAQSSGSTQALTADAPSNRMFILNVGTL